MATSLNALDEHSQPKLIVVYDYTDSSKSFEEAINAACNDGFGLIAYPLVDHIKDVPALIDLHHQLGSKENELNHPQFELIGNVPFNFDTGTPSNIFQSIYGKTSQWVHFQHPNEELNASYLQLLIHEIDWAVHLEIYYLILPPPKVRGHGIESGDGKIGDMDIDHESGSTATLDDAKSIDDADITECAFNYASSIITATAKHSKLVLWVPIPFNITGWKLWKKLVILLRNCKSLRPGTPCYF